MNGVYFKVAEEESDLRLGELIDAALLQSNEVPAPPSTRTGPSPLEPVFQELGVKSYSQYIKGMRVVSVRLDDDERVHVRPDANEGVRGGFVPMPDEFEIQTQHDPLEIARAVRRAFVDAK